MIMTGYPSAGDLCRLITSRIDGVASTEWPGGSAYAHGAGSNDAILAGLEHTTTILVVGHGRERWFTLEVREFNPAQDTALTMDYDVLRALARRAGITPPPFSS
jgi:hypothetical protein